ncbi:MAG TPA: choice-of-anchor E domain-containing protein [Verrucomicrobiae bacterium]|jgi:hypothetical protein|nr:choice-of-anchor E domain-containing protein [Verrucomicrobiae bacterium]
MTLTGHFERVRRGDVVGGIWHGRRAELASGWKFFIAVLLCCCGNGAGAAMSTITETVSLTPELTDYSDAPVAFQKFDASLGRLCSVEIILQGTGELTQQYENTSKRAASKQFHQSLELLLTLPDARHPFLKARQNENHNYRADAFDGDVDFGGASGDASTYAVAGEDRTRLTSRQRLGFFTGSGLADLFLSTRTRFNGRANAKSIREAQVLAGADITIVYNYVPVSPPVLVSVPEPDGYAVGTGLVGLVAAMAWPLRKSFGSCR